MNLGPVYNGGMEPLDLDANATTPLLPAAWDAMQPALRNAYGNPASAHGLGRRARQLLEDARESCAAALGASPEELVFTSGATEANNLAIFGLAGTAGAHILASAVEHPCTIEPLRQLESRGAAIEWLPVDARGIISVDATIARVRPTTRLVSAMLASHETGAIQPVSAIARGLPPGVLLHTDAAQAVGKMPVSFRELGAAAFTASAHKFGGPKGIGMLVLRRGVSLSPLLFGGHQQQGRRPGTEPVALAVGMAAALEHALRNLDAHRRRWEALRALLWERLQALAGPVVLNGPAIGSPQVVPNVLNVSFPGCRGDLLLMALDLAGVACSTGSACSSGSLLPSPVLQAMGVPDDVLRSAIRFSFGAEWSEEKMVEAASRIARVVRQVREPG